MMERDATPLLDRARTDGREGHASHTTTTSGASNKPWGRHELKRPASLRAALGKPERVAADGNGTGSKEVEGGARATDGENHGAWHQAPPPSFAQPLPMDHDRGSSLGEMQCVWDNPPLRDVRMYSPPSTPPDSPASRHHCVLCCSCVAWVRVRAVRCGRWLCDQLAVGFGSRGKDKEDGPDDSSPGRDRERERERERERDRERVGLATKGGGGRVDSMAKESGRIDSAYDRVDNRNHMVKDT